MNKVKYLLFTNRYSLIESFEKIKKKIIYCEKNSFGEKFCKIKKIKYKTYFSKRNFLNILKKNLDSKVFTNGCKYLIPTDLLKKFKFTPVNIHPSLLPNYKGQFVIDKIFYNKEKKIGASIHEIDSKVDNGKIIHQKIFINDEKSLIINLYHKLFRIEKIVFDEYFFLNKKNNLKIKKKKILSIKKKSFYRLSDLKKISFEFIQSQCVPKKYIKIFINSKIKKIIHCEQVKKKDYIIKNLNYIKLPNEHILFINKLNQKILIKTK